MAVFYGLIQVSGRARNWRVCKDAQVETVSAFLTADWQFHSPPSTSSSVLVENVSNSRDWLDYSLEQCVSIEILSV